MTLEDLRCAAFGQRLVVMLFVVYGTFMDMARAGGFGSIFARDDG
jgi:hypothetical protein